MWQAAEQVGAGFQGRLPHLPPNDIKICAKKTEQILNGPGLLMSTVSQDSAHKDKLATRQRCAPICAKEEVRKPGIRCDVVASPIHMAHFIVIQLDRDNRVCWFSRSSS